MINPGGWVLVAAFYRFTYGEQHMPEKREITVKEVFFSEKVGRCHR
jgi:hypothetical protein